MKLKFEVYIGENMVYGQNSNIRAVVIPVFDIPAGQYDLSGNVITKSKNQHFISLFDLGTYFCDWLDMCDSQDRIEARIHLNINSLVKSFKDYEIVQFINKLEHFSNYEEVRNFKEVI